jgi:hypothetical protein
MTSENRHTADGYLLSSSPLLCRAGSGESSSTTEKVQDHREFIQQLVTSKFMV